MPYIAPSDPPQPPPRARRISASLAAALGLGLTIAACGGSTPPASTSSGQAPQNGVTAAYKYSSCMRSHGATGFPDPKVSTTGNSTAIAIAVPSSLGNSPAFKTAEKACQGILPAPQSPAQRAADQRAHGQALLALARCMRSHGVANFPDPNAQGQLPLDTVRAAGVDLQSPSILRTAEGCASVTHGLITAAQIAQGVRSAQ